jgi:hypothetical protein
LVGPDTPSPGFWRKSAEAIGETRDRRATENERVRKRLKSKRGESGVEEKRTKEGVRRWLAGSGAIITGYDSASIVTLSIVNYVVHHSNGPAFEWAGIPMVEAETGFRRGRLGNYEGMGLVVLPK